MKRPIYALFTSKSRPPWMASWDNYEIILVDDGSTDDSFELMQALHREDPRVVVIQFRRNFGQSAAFAAGFDYAQGDVIVTLDADLQNDPADIPMLMERLEEGYDVVSGWRKNRKDNIIRKIRPCWRIG